MNTNKNSYTIIYAIIMVVVVALLLALVSGALSERQAKNISLDKKKQILNSLNINLEGADAEELYKQYIVDGFTINSEGKVIDQSKEKAFEVDMKKEMAKPLSQRVLPIYVAQIEGKTKYIFTLQGAGLWGAIWGYMALNEDKNSIYGVFYSHASETPGLGAEIAHKAFQDKFIGKKILNTSQEFVSISIVKPGQVDTEKEYVDGISGGTITCKGVETMLMNSLGQYKAFFTQTKTVAKGGQK